MIRKIKKKTWRVYSEKPFRTSLLLKTEKP